MKVSNVTEDPCNPTQQMARPALSIGITGATGFVGDALVRHLAQTSTHRLRVAVRDRYDTTDKSIEVLSAQQLTADHAWQPFVTGLDVIIHCAARVHVLHDTSTDPRAEYFEANVAATLNLAERAAAAGVKRFVFVSSIKVNGEFSRPGSPFTADAVGEPSDAYGQSKQAAEQGLRDLALRTGMEVVIIRPVLVYGPGVKANFLSMLRWLDKGVPMPLGAIHNRRSLVARGNLVDLLVTCVDHPAAANQTFLVSDGEDLSTTQLLQRMGRALGRPARLLPIPAWLLSGLAIALGKRAFAQRLCGSLQVDIDKTRKQLGWTPPVSVEQAMQETADHYLETKRNA